MSGEHSEKGIVEKPLKKLVEIHDEFRIGLGHFCIGVLGYCIMAAGIVACAIIQNISYIYLIIVGALCGVCYCRSSAHALLCPGCLSRDGFTLRKVGGHVRSRACYAQCRAASLPHLQLLLQRPHPRHHPDLSAMLAHAPPASFTIGSLNGTD